MIDPRAAATASIALLLLVAPCARGQEALTLDAVLQRRTALAAPLPRALWLPGGGATVVVTASDGDETLHRIADGKVAAEPLLDAAAARRAIGETVRAPAQFPAMAWRDDTTLRFEAGRAVFHYQLDAPSAEAVLRWPAPETDPLPFGAPEHAVAPGDGHVVYRHRHQLWLQGRDGERRQLTFDGSPDLVYGGAAHRAEFGIDRGLFWRADGQRFAFYREDQRLVAAYPFQALDTHPPGPRHGRYPVAGHVHAKVEVGVADTDGRIVWLERDPDEDVYWTPPVFAPDDTLVIARVDRGQRHVELVRYDARTGRRLAALVAEHDSRWVEPEHPPVFLTDGRFLWWSAQDGYRHLWLFDADGSSRHQVTRGAFDVQQLHAVSADERMVWFAASGEDPRQLHLFAANLADGEVKQVTRERGTHLASLSPDATAAHLVWSNLDTRPAARLLSLATGEVTPLPAAADPLAGFALPRQRLFQVTSDDGAVLYGHVALPADWQEGQRCPVLLYVYGGPHVQLVTDRWLGGAPMWLQSLCADGIAVCRLDNRGTPNRGIEFEQVIHRRLGTIEVEDQLLAVRWLENQAFVDPGRIGVHGWSYGGYMTLRLLLLAPARFACGISGAPVTDWGLYETGYTERYMDGPLENPAGYAASSCLPLAGNLQRPLLLVHGTDDDTVLPAHSLLFVDRCIAAGKQLDFFPYPLQKHGLAGAHRDHFLRLMRDYLRRHLRPHERLFAEAAAAGNGTVEPGK